MKTLKELVRPNIWQLKPYSSARDEFHGAASVFLDANENPFNTQFNRYPDPLQWKLKTRLAKLKGIDKHTIFLGNGSDEPIDLIYRMFCEPGTDNVVSIAPSYGMYEVAADINNVVFRKVLLDEAFDLDVKGILAATDAHTKVIFLCSPNNPTGNSLTRSRIFDLLNAFDGIVVVDEAYIDFSTEPSFLVELSNYPQLIVLQTLSKAWGAAGIRLGMAFASPEIIKILNKIKYPYNINQLTQQQAFELLNQEEAMSLQLQTIIEERDRLYFALEMLPYINEIYPTDANFFLINVGDADKIYDYLVTRGIIVRNRNNITKCRGCIRITVGTPKENNALLEALKDYMA